MRFVASPELAAVTVFLLATGDAELAQARPTAPGDVCTAEPTIPACQGGVPACSLCHDATDPPSWNSFGMALKEKINPDADFDTELPKALAAIANQDSDGDGISNLEELMRGSAPGHADATRELDAGVSAGENPQYRVGRYDYAFAFRRVGILYCGRSPTYEELEALKAGTPDDATLKKRLHEKLASCLESQYWQREALPRLADKRIRPLTAAGPDSNIQIAGYRLVIGDYNYDYRLWRYALTGNRDMRDLLTGQYHVLENEDGTLKTVTGILPKSDDKALAGGQPVPDDKRAGMLTTQWFLAINTMFSALPRTTAAQAYRSYLGADISSGEGLRPVPGEPLDVDGKGVNAPRCANCHSTLDPMAYVFAEYEGIDNSANLRFGAYEPDRPKNRIPNWDMTKQKAELFGKSVKDLLEYSHVAAASDEFKRAMVDMFFQQAFAREPLPEEQDAFAEVWGSLPADGYSADRLLHRLIDTLSFGRP